MRWALLGYSASILAHLAIAGGVLRIPKSVETQARPVTMFQAKKSDKARADKKADADEKEQDKPKPPPPKPRTENAPPTPKNAPLPLPEAAPAHRALTAMPDFGISLGGLAVGGPGIAVPVPGALGPGASGAGQGGVGAAPAAPKEVKSKVFAARPKTDSAEEGCEEEPIKPKQMGIVRPQYTDDARSAGIEGKVRVEITIGRDGEVSAAHVLSGLGHGLDEAAITAAKHMKFSPATRCGKAVESKFVISIRFSLVE